MGQANQHTGDTELDSQISFVLAHPGMSSWLKNAIQGAMEQDPLSSMNDVEILQTLLRRRAEVHLAREFRRPTKVTRGFGFN